MEDVLDRKNNELKGFISPEGLFVRVTNVSFEESDTSEIIAESICRNVLNCDKTLDEMAQILYLKQIEFSYMTIFKNYLIEQYGYLYLHIKYLEDKVDICELSSSVINDIQKNKVIHFCKQNIEAEETVKQMIKK